MGGPRPLRVDPTCRRGADVTTATSGFTPKRPRTTKTASPQGRGNSPNRANAEKFLSSCSKPLLGQQATESTERYCKVLKGCGGEKKGSTTTDVGSENTMITPSHLVMSVGFVSLPSSSRGSATFADIRKTIEKELDASTLPPQWQFYVPKLGPVSAKQEDSRGPVLTFLQHHHRPTPWRWYYREPFENIHHPTS